MSSADEQKHLAERYAFLKRLKWLSLGASICGLALLIFVIVGLLPRDGRPGPPPWFLIVGAVAGTLIVAFALNTLIVVRRQLRHIEKRESDLPEPPA
ncbi:MAG: hypothetical protein GX900_02135 [Clostridiaceae bacterium]|nr:hypothetical protein [Clostridiaceae bacterium]